MFCNCSSHNTDWASTCD
ncbi:hypothetical protein D030_1881A, partial [Vibrio parahaemolyticus AQ3810]